MDGKKAFQFYLRQARSKPKRGQKAPEPPQDDAVVEPTTDAPGLESDAPAHPDEVQQVIDHLMAYPPVTDVRMAPSGDLLLYRGTKRQVVKAPERKEGISKEDWSQLAELAQLVAQVKNAVVDVSLEGATLRIEYSESEPKDIELPSLGGGGGVSTIEKGWSPVLSVVEDGERRVLKVTDWTGGGGSKPAADKYIGPSGFVTDIAEATDIRGEAGSGGGGSSDFAAVVARTFEPTGFVDRAESALSWNDGTRTLTVSPVGDSFEVYTKGTLREYTEQTYQIADTSGPHFIYFDGDTGAIDSLTTFDISLLTEHAYVAVIYWNADQQLAVLVGDERHGCVMDNATHAHLHNSLGTLYVSGLGLVNMSVDGDGSSDTHAKLGVNDGQVNDEDIPHTIADGSPQTLRAVLNAPLLWRIGETWKIGAQDTIPLMYSGRESWAGTLPAYNYDAGSSGWALDELSNNEYTFAHILATNDIRHPVMVVMGDRYTTKNNARSAALTAILELDGLPFTEFRPIGTVIFQAKTAFTSTPKAVVVSTEDGGDYIDFRRSLSLGGSGIAAQDVPAAPRIYVGPLAGAPATVDSPTFLLISEDGAAARDTRMIIRKPAS